MSIHNKYNELILKILYIILILKYKNYKLWFIQKYLLRYILKQTISKIKKQILFIF